MKLVLVPRTDHVFAVEPALAQRPAHVVAEIRDHTELAVPVGSFMFLSRQTAQAARSYLRCSPELAPPEYMQGIASEAEGEARQLAVGRTVAA
jgi:hypothetical protein